MSKIQSIQPNYQPKSKQGQTKFAQNPSFRGGASSLEDKVAEYGRKNIESKIKLSWITQFLQKHKGELQTQGINALFTGTLAPLFIAFNPISKQDDKTKQYTALRQPISAVNSILVSVPLTIMLNQHTEKIASEGAIKSIDLRCCPDSNHLGRIFKKEYKAVKDDKVKLEAWLNDFSTAEEREKVKHDMKLLYPNSKEQTLEKQVHKSIMELYVKKKQEKATAFYTELLYKDPVALRNNSEIQSKVKGLNEYLKENNLHEIDFKKFMKDNFNIEFLTEKIKENGTTKINSELKETAFLKQLKQIKATDFLRKMGLVSCKLGDDGKFTTDKFSEESLRKFLSIQRGEPVIQTLMKTRKICREAAEKEVEALSKMFARHIQYNIDGKMLSEESITLHQMLETLGIEPKTFMEDVKTKKASVVMEEFAKKLKGLDGLVGTETKDIASQLMKIRTKVLTAKFGGIKQYVGIFFNLGIVAITCTTLNWAYPRIVEKLFPSLVKDENKKGENK